MNKNEKIEFEILSLIAYDRDELESKILSHIRGGFHYLVKSSITKKNGKIREYKKNILEVRYEIEKNFLGVLLFPCKKTINRRRITNKCIKHVKSTRESNENLTESDLNWFWELVERTACKALET